MNTLNRGKQNVIKPIPIVSGWNCVYHNYILFVLSFFTNIIYENIYFIFYIVACKHFILIYI